MGAPELSQWHSEHTVCLSPHIPAVAASLSWCLASRHPKKRKNKRGCSVPRSSLTWTGNEGGVVLSPGFVQPGIPGNHPSTLKYFRLWGFPWPCPGSSLTAQVLQGALLPFAPQIFDACSWDAAEPLLFLCLLPTPGWVLAYSSPPTPTRALVCWAEGSLS